jgi:outer membrane protein
MKKILATLLAGAALVAAGSATAQVPEGNWLIRARAIWIGPNESNNATGGANGQLIGADDVKISDKWAPEVDITYFFTRNIAAELVLTYPQKHDVEWTNSPLTTPPGQTLGIGNIKQIPPTLLGQYHFPLQGGWKPYVGAGVTLFYITDNNLSVPGVGNVLQLRKTNWGLALQGGVDYALNKNWYLNADVKYIFVETKLTDNANLGIDTMLKVNPWVLGLGVGYRF